MSGMPELLVRAIEKCLDDRAIAVPCSGGLDSSLMAFVAARKTKVQLITLGTEGCEDIGCAKRFAEWSGLLHFVQLLSEKRILELYEKCFSLFPADMLRVELAIPVYECARIASEKGLGTMLSGQGAEELFVGYERYYDYLKEGKDLDKILREEIANIGERELKRNEKMAAQFGIETKYPFLDEKLVEAVLSIPLEQRISRHDRGKKVLLRAAARELGLPEFVCSRPKKAVQYGSGIHAVLMRNRKMIDARFPSLPGAGP